MKRKKYLAKIRAMDLRKELGYGLEEPLDIFSLLMYREKISVIKMLLSKNISGLTISKGNEKAIVINSSMTLGRQIFTAAHEYYHLKFDNEYKYKNDEVEEMANTFASHFLMPTVALETMVFNRLENFKRDKIIISDVLFLENYFKMSHIAMLRRLKEEKLIPTKTYDEFLEIKRKETAIKYGYSKALYEKTNEKDIYSDYVEIVEMCLTNNKISMEKYEEFLIEGGFEGLIYRDDEINPGDDKE